MTLSHLNIFKLKLIYGDNLSILDELYPDFKIDIKREQEKLEKSDIIVLQFPLFWLWNAINNEQMDGRYIQTWMVSRGQLEINFRQRN